MTKKRTLLIAAGVLAVIGAAAAVSAQGHRGHWRGGPMQFGGGDDFGLGGPGGGGLRGRFAGSLTKDEFDNRSRERFARLDRNSDGFIDAAEIEPSINNRMSQMRQHMGGPQGAGMGDRLIRMFDADKDGKATKDEFLAGIRKRFAEFDLDNDGRITDADLPPMMRGRNALAGGGAGGLSRQTGMGMGFPMMRWLADADANKDGAITLDEALAAAERRFVAADRNKDGAIDKADFDTMRKEMVDYRVKRFIHHFGADKDGKVSREQFAKKTAERFAQMDLDNNGTIDRNELPGRGRWFGREHGQGHGSGRGMHQGQDGGQMPGGQMPGGMGPKSGPPGSR